MDKEKIDAIIEDKMDNLSKLDGEGMIKELKEIANILKESDYAQEYPELYEAKQKGIHDYISNIEGAMREGRKIRKLLREGVAINKIAESVLSSEEEIREIKENLN